MKSKGNCCSLAKVSNSTLRIGESSTKPQLLNDLLRFRSGAGGFAGESLKHCNCINVKSSLNFPIRPFLILLFFSINFTSLIINRRKENTFNVKRLENLKNDTFSLFLPFTSGRQDYSHKLPSLFFARLGKSTWKYENKNKMFGKPFLFCYKINIRN